MKAIGQTLAPIWEVLEGSSIDPTISGRERTSTDNPNYAQSRRRHPSWAQVNSNSKSILSELRWLEIWYTWKDS